MQGRGLNVCVLEKIVGAGVPEAMDGELSRSGKPSRQLYEALTVSDQALMREFYLERIEKVDVKVRDKYRKVYQYY